MSKKVDITKAQTEYLNLISDKEALEIIHKGWSLSFVYSFREIRDVFLAFCKYGQKDISVAGFSNRYVKDKIPFEKKPWDEKGRRVLEIKNALINFGLMEKGSLLCKPDVFENVEPGTPVSEADLLVFREIFFNYFRFKEFSSLLLSPVMDKQEKLSLTEQRIIGGSSVLYYYATEGGRVDSFFYTLNHPEVIYQIPKSEEDGSVKGGFVRFWDVFLSWATQLGLIERLNMKTQDYILSSGNSFRACYFVNPFCKIDIHGLLCANYKRQQLIDVSQLIMELCLRYRCSINTAQQTVIDYYQSNTEKVSLIRTSEIFIKERELNKNDRILYPNYKGSFISHIKIRSL